MNKGTDKRGRPRRSVPRRLAEWVSLGISILLIGGIAVYLVYQGIRSQTPFVPVEVQIEAAQAERARGQFILPIVVKNVGDRTLRDVRIEIRYAPPNQPRRQQDFDLDYLGERAEQRIFIYLDHDPRSIAVEARAVQYRLE